MRGTNHKATAYSKEGERKSFMGKNAKIYPFKYGS